MKCPAHVHNIEGRQKQPKKQYFLLLLLTCLKYLKLIISLKEKQWALKFCSHDRFMNCHIHTLNPFFVCLFIIFRLPACCSKDRECTKKSMDCECAEKSDYSYLSENVLFFKSLIKVILIYVSMVMFEPKIFWVKDYPSYW